MSINILKMHNLNVLYEICVADFLTLDWADEHSYRL